MIKVGIECESTEGDSWGIGRSVRELIKEIQRRPELSKEFEFVYYYKKGIPSFSLYYYVVLPLKIFFTKPDVVFFPNYMLPYGVFCKTIVSLTEDLYREMNGNDLPMRYRLAYKIFSNHAARKATMINVYSKTSGREVARLFGIEEKRIFVNYLGVRANDFRAGFEAEAGTDSEGRARPKPHSGLAGATSMSEKIIPPDTFVLYVGQMFPRRHAKETMLACKKLGVKIITVGVDKYRPPLQIEGEHYDRVSDEKLEELYRNARLFVYVSDTEAFGLPPLEALARGVTPVVADTAVAHELLGDDAIYTEPTVDGIAEAIKRGLSLPKPQPMIKFTWQSHTDRFLDLCRKFQK